MVSFSANMEPPDANMEPPDEGTTRRPRAMTEMIFLAIALLVGMMTVPCFRASVVQRRIAFEGFPLACLVLLTSVLVTLASTSTFPILSVPHVPFVTILPPAPRSSTPCMPLTCPSLPEMYQTGIPHVKELHGTCNRSSGESWDLKNFAVAEMPLFVPVRDDLPRSHVRCALHSPPAISGPCLFPERLCTTGCCFSMGPKQLTQAGCMPRYCHCARIAALCTTPPAYEDNTYRIPSDQFAVASAWSSVLVMVSLAVLLLVYPQHARGHRLCCSWYGPQALAAVAAAADHVPRARGHRLCHSWCGPKAQAAVAAAADHVPHARDMSRPSPAAAKLLLLVVVLASLVPIAEGAATESPQERHARLIRSMGLEAVIAACTVVFGLAALRNRFADSTESAACDSGNVGAAAPVSVGAATAHNATTSLAAARQIAAAWRAFRQTHASLAEAKLAAALAEASRTARSAPLAQATGAYAPPPHHTAAAQILIRSWRAIAARRRAATGCALLKAIQRSAPALQSATTRSSASASKLLRLPPGLGLTGVTASPGATKEALAAREKLRRHAERKQVAFSPTIELLQSTPATALAASPPVTVAAPLTGLTPTALTFVGAGDSLTVPSVYPARRERLAEAAEARQMHDIDRRTPRSQAFRQRTSRQSNAGKLLASVRPQTWLVLAFCFRLRRRAEQSAAAQLSNRLLQHPQCAHFVAYLRARVSRRSAALKLLSSPPRPLPHDIGYDGSSGKFSFRDPRGKVTYQHPAFGASAGTIPAYGPDGSVVQPLSPPLSSMVVLRPEASGAWCYCDAALGTASWYPPDGSTPLVTRLFPDVPPVSEERPPRIPSHMGLNSLAGTGWAPIFRDGTHEVLLVHQQTGAVRIAPWIALRTRHGRVYFANLLTWETRWLPPHLWMHGWASRLDVDSPASAIAAADNRSMSQTLSNGGHDLPCDWRKPLPTLVGRERVEGGAPYMYEPAHGVPQYPPDNQWDSQLTYPLEGNYVRWPRTSTPSLPPGSDRSLGLDGKWELPRESWGRIWLTIAAADAADQRKATLRAPARPTYSCGTYAAEPAEFLEKPLAVLYHSGPGEPLSGLEDLDAASLHLDKDSTWNTQQPEYHPTAEDEFQRLQELEDEAEYWRVHEELEHQDARDEAAYWRAAAFYDEMLERQRVLAVEQAIETSRHAPPPDIYVQAERSRSRPASFPAAPETLASQCAPLLVNHAPRLADHALLLRAVDLIQRAWFWYVYRCFLTVGWPAVDSSGGGAPRTPSGRRLPASGKRICRPTELCMKGEAMLHARHPFGTTSDILLTPPPFRFLLRLPLFDPIDSGVLPPAPNSGYY